jgi:hypothetical protein
MGQQQQGQQQQQQQQQQGTAGPPKAPSEVTDWAFQEVAGQYSSAAEAGRKLREAVAKGCKIIGGMSNMPLPLGHEMCVTVVPIAEESLYPLNAHARAFVKGPEAMKKLKEEERAEQMRWGLGKSIINSLATAVAVEWLRIARIDSQTVPYYCKIQVWGRYKQVDGTFRPITATDDMDFRDGSAQVSGKTDAQIVQLRATIERKAETGAKLRALREAFGIDHGINDDQIDRPFVISRVVFTGKSEDPELRRIFANAIAMGHLASMGALFGTQGPTGPLAPHLGSGSIPAAALPQGSVGLDDGDEADPAETRAAAAAASGAPVVPPLPPQAPKPAPAPGDPARVYLPGKGKEAPTVAKAAAKDLTYWEARLRREFDEGMDERYAHKNTVLLLTIRAFSNCRFSVISAISTFASLLIYSTCLVFA